MKTVGGGDGEAGDGDDGSGDGGAATIGDNVGGGDGVGGGGEGDGGGNGLGGLGGGIDGDGMMTVMAGAESTTTPETPALDKKVVAPLAELSVVAREVETVPTQLTAPSASSDAGAAMITSMFTEPAVTTTSTSDALTPASVAKAAAIASVVVGVKSLTAP